MSLSLKRLISKEVLSFIGALGEGAVLLIEDANGKGLFGKMAGKMPFKHPVQYLEGRVAKVIGWVSGDDKALPVASLLSHLASLENEKRDLGRETLEKYKELTLLYGISEKLAVSLNPKEIARLIIEEARKVFRADFISVMIINEETGFLEVFDHSGKEKGPEGSLKPGEGLIGSIVITGKAEVVNEVHADPRYVQGVVKVSSLMCAPLKIKDKVIGVINVSSKEPLNYSAEDLKLLSALALQAAASIENARLYDSLKETFLTSVHTLAETIEKRDPYTGGHTKRVMEYSLSIGNSLGMSGETLETLRLAAILHDVGKIGVRDQVLLKNGRLDDEEFAEMRKHTVYGEEVLTYIKQFKDIIPGVKSHHERYDGRGYPEGLKGEKIHILARIIAVADSFDAMTSDRPYRKSMDIDVALNEIRENANTQFDPVVVKAFFQAYGLDK